MTAPAAVWDGRDRRALGWYNALQRACNTVFLFFLNPLLDPINNRISGTRLMAWVVVWVNVWVMQRGHTLAEIRVTKTAAVLAWTNVALYALAFGFWFGPKGMEWMLDLVKAWKGRGDDEAR